MYQYTFNLLDFRFLLQNTHLLQIALLSKKKHNKRMKISYNIKSISEGGNVEGLLNSAVLELLELSKLDSPYSSKLIELHRKKLVSKLLQKKSIDEETANYLNE